VSTESEIVSGPSVGDVVAERYRIERVLVADAPRRRMIAVEKNSELSVELVELPMSMAAAWTAAMTIEYAGLVPLLATLSRHGSSFGLFEHSEARTLGEWLDTGAAYRPEAAVELTLSLVGALQRLRKAGILHGAVGPEAVLIDDSGPKLAYRGPLPAGSVYRPPERTENDSPEPADDVWGVCAVLFHLLAGAPPPKSGIHSEEELAIAGIEDELLRGVVAQGLAPHPARRSERLASLLHPLSAWLARRPSQPRQAAAPVAVDPSAPVLEVRATPLSEPPSGSALIPSTSAPPAELVAPRSLPGKRSRSPLWLAAPALTLAAAAAAFVMTRGGSVPPERPSAAVVPSPPPAPESSAAPAEPNPVAELAPVAKPAPVPESERICLARYLPEGSFVVEEEIGFLCSTHDPRVGDQQMRKTLIRAAGLERNTASTRLWRGLSWYGMAGFAVLRAACCPGAPPLELPEPGEGCDPIARVLDDLGREAVDDGDTEEPLVRFQAAIACEIRQRRSNVYWRDGRPSETEPIAVRDLVSRVRRRVPSGSE
jgi:hypothetical protein